MEKEERDQSPAPLDIEPNPSEQNCQYPAPHRFATTPGRPIRWHFKVKHKLDCFSAFPVLQMQTLQALA